MTDLNRYAYTAIETRPRKFGVVLCEEDVQGYRPVHDYGPYDDETRAEGIAQRLNARIGISQERARDIVRSTMVRAATASSCP